MLSNVSEEKNKILEAHERLEKDLKQLRDKHSKLGLYFFFY